MLNMKSSSIYSVDVKQSVRYLADQSDSEKSHHVFAYTMTITNQGTVAAKLLSRHWHITDANGKTHEVKGKGVIGKQPHLQPGESFQYTSFAVLITPIGCMHGSYQMLADDGTHFDATINAFSLSLPAILH